jgi:hypothetical protein
LGKLVPCRERIDGVTGEMLRMTSVRAFFVLVPRPLTCTFVLFVPSLIPVWERGIW